MDHIVICHPSNICPLNKVQRSVLQSILMPKIVFQAWISLSPAMGNIGKEQDLDKQLIAVTCIMHGHCMQVKSP